MVKHTFLTILFITLLLILAGLYFTSLVDPLKNHAGLPWQVETLPEGNTRVFSLTLGKSHLLDAEKLFKSIAEVTLFKNEDGKLSIEAFFGDVKIAGLKSKMVMSIDLSQQQMNEMFSRGSRISTLGSGTRKVTLSGEDAEFVRHSPISSITYLPSIHLNDALIEKRFGVPDQKLNDPLSDAVHWLYPGKGVDVALSEENKEVIQYVLPEKFDTLMQPLIVTE